jgi:chromosomal replication initiation ATPase DnaA
MQGWLWCAHTTVPQLSHEHWYKNWGGLIGSSGVGKTHLAIALGLAACGQGRKLRFFRVTELITLLLGAREEKQFLRFRKQLKQLDLIILVSAHHGHPVRRLDRTGCRRLSRDWQPGVGRV